MCAGVIRKQIKHVALGFLVADCVNTNLLPEKVGSCTVALCNAEYSCTTSYKDSKVSKACNLPLEFEADAENGL